MNAYRNGTQSDSLTCSEKEGRIGLGKADAHKYPFKQTGEVVGVAGLVLLRLMSFVYGPGCHA